MDGLVWALLLQKDTTPPPGDDSPGDLHARSDEAAEPTLRARRRIALAVAATAVMIAACGLATHWRIG